MTPNGFKLALGRLGVRAKTTREIDAVAKMFGRSRRAVHYWLSPTGDGPPEHVALAVHAMLEGTIEQSHLKRYVNKARTRRDGGRYRQTEKRP
jgi:hypothetical protein